jgi:hypothetical protein
VATDSTNRPFFKQVTDDLLRAAELNKKLIWWIQIL